MGRLLNLLQAAAGERSLNGMTGRWRQAVSETFDGGIRIMGRTWSLLQAAAGEVQISSATGQWMQAVTDAAESAALLCPFTLESRFDNRSITPPADLVTVDSFAYADDEPGIATDPNNPNRLCVVEQSRNEFIWSCLCDTSCSGVGFVIGSWYSNDGGSTWCCPSTSESDRGGIVPGVQLLVGGTYENMSDPSAAFDTLGNVFTAGLGFNSSDRRSEIYCAKGTFGSAGNLTWGSTPAVISVNVSPTIMLDKPWLAVDIHAASPFKDRVYVSFTKFTFSSGKFVHNDIMFAYSTDHGATFSVPAAVTPPTSFFNMFSYHTTGADGTIYLVYWGKPDSTSNVLYVSFTKSTDGGVTFSVPTQIVSYSNVAFSLQDSEFRCFNIVNVAVTPTNDIYVVYNAEVPLDESTLTYDANCDFQVVGIPAVKQNCKNVCLFVKSTDGGTTWSAPQIVFPQGNRTAEGYPAGGLQPPAPYPIQDTQNATAVNPITGDVYVGSYRGTFVSPWQTCAEPGLGGDQICCNKLGDFIHNTRFEYVVKNLNTGVVTTLSTHPINSRYGPFAGGGTVLFAGKFIARFTTFMGDYTDMKFSSDGTLHAVWTDTNSVKTLSCYRGIKYDPPPEIHNTEIVHGSIP
jgi:hypothetical protein